MKFKNTLRACIALPAFAAFMTAPRAENPGQANERYRILAGAALARETTSRSELRNGDRQDEIHVLGLYLNLRRGRKAYSTPALPPASDEEPADAPRDNTGRGQKPALTPEPNAKMKIFYQAQLALLIRPGAKYFPRNPGGSSFAGPDDPRVGTRTPRASDLFLLPGRNLFLGLDPKYCGDCSLLLGYSEPGQNDPGSPARNILTGARGGGMGLHLRFAHRAYGELRVLPFFLPAYSDRGSALHAPRAIFYKESFARPAHANNSMGSRLEYRVKLAGLELGLHYARRREKGERGELRSEYTGFGLGGNALPGLHAYISVERMQGNFRGRESTLSAPKAPPPQPEGGALRMGGEYRRGDFKLNWNLFLPQTAARIPGERETTGYILAGVNPMDAFILGGTLNARPAPRSRRLLTQAPETDSDSIIGGEHAGTFALRGVYTHGLYEYSLGLDFLQPLRDKTGGGAFAVQKKDGESYLEVSLGLAARLGASRARLTYARLYFRGPEGRRTAGEAVYFMLEYAP